MEKKICLYLISGFLGAGKTTFLKSILEKSRTIKVGVIVNEFGSIGIDGKILMEGEIKIVEINNGSIFCSCMKSGFIKTLIAFLEQPIDVLFVEASGMADPSSMKKLLEQITELTGPKQDVMKSYDYRGSVCLVDCTTFLDYCEVLTPTRNQVIKSNFIVINKIDLVDLVVVENTRKMIRMLNPDAFIYDTTYGQVPLEIMEDYLTIGNETAHTSNQPWNRPKTCVLDMEGTYQRDKIISFSEELSETALRMKGFFKDQKQLYHLDVAGKSIQITGVKVSDENSSLFQEPRIIIIGKDHAEIKDRIQAIWNGIFSTNIIFVES